MAAFENPLVEQAVFLVGINAGERHVLVERVHRHFKGGKVRIKQDDFFAGGEQVVKNFFVAVAHHAFEPRGGGVPIQPVFQEQQRHMVEMAAQQAAALGFGQFGIAQPQINQPDAARGTTSQ